MECFGIKQLASRFMWHFFEYSWNILYVCLRAKGQGLKYRIFKEYSRNYFINQLLLMGRIFSGIFLGVQLFVMFLFHFFLKYSWNIPIKMEQKHVSNSCI